MRLILVSASKSSVDKGLPETIRSQTDSYQSFFGPLVKFFNRCVTNNGVYFFIALLIYVTYLVLKIFFGNLLSLLSTIFFCCVRARKSQEVKNQTVHFCYRVQDEYIADELQLYNIQKEEGILKTDSILTKLQENRFKFYRNKKANLQSSNSKYTSVPTFTTLPSYDYRLHPSLKELYMSNN